MDVTRREFLRLSGASLAGACVLGLPACGNQTGGGQTGEAEGDSGWEPTQDVVMVVPADPGGGSDAQGRAIASGVEEVRSEVNVNVEYHPGGSTAVGYSYMLEQQGDPHFLLPSETGVVTLPILSDVPYHWTDFTPIAQIANDNIVLFVREDSPFESMQDVSEAAKQGDLTAGITTVGGPDDIVARLFAQNQNIESERVGFDSGAAAGAALLAGDLDVVFNNPGDFLGQLEAGKLRALAVFAEERYASELLRDVPTSVEQGVEVTFSQWRGPFAAGEISENAREYWEEAITEWSKTEGYEKYIEDNFLDPELKTGQEFEDFLNEYEALAKRALETATNQ